MYDYQSNHSTESPLIFKVTNMMKCKYIYGFSDIDECKGNHSCHVNATCTNTNGSYLCECHPGFNGNGQNCTGEFNIFAIIFRIFLLESNLKLLRWPYYQFLVCKRYRLCSKSAQSCPLMRFLKKKELFNSSMFNSFSPKNTVGTFKQLLSTIA